MTRRARKKSSTVIYHVILRGINRSLIFKWLNRRSQKNSFNWNKFALFLKKYPLPRAKTYVSIFDLGAGQSYLM